MDSNWRLELDIDQFIAADDTITGMCGCIYNYITDHMRRISELTDPYELQVLLNHLDYYGDKSDLDMVDNVLVRICDWGDANDILFSEEVQENG